MAPMRTPGKKRQREGDYLAVGKEGRKTGLTVPELGPRDEHGLEPVDNLFSSPQKGPTPHRQNGAVYASESESMSIMNGTSDNASSVIRSARQASLVPPRSRSPRKTNFGSSPQRLYGQVSSPLQKHHSLSAAPRRSGKFDKSGNGRLRLANTSSPDARYRNRQNERSAADTSKMEAQGGRRQTYTTLDEEEQSEAESGINGAGDVQDEIYADDAAAMDMDDEPEPEAYADDEPGPPMFDDEDAEPELVEEASPIQELPKVKRAAKRKSSELDAADDAVDAEEQAEPSRKRGRLQEQREEDDADEVDEQETSLVDAAPMPAPIAAPAKQRRGPGQRNPKARISSTKSRQKDKGVSSAAASRKPKDVDSTAEDANAGKRKPKGRPMLHLVDDTPQIEEEVALKVLRSGRTSVKPLAFWRGEQIVYEPPKRTGQGWEPGGYRGIDPGRKNAEPQPKTTKRKTNRKRAVSREQDVSEDENQDLWETEGETPGILATGVPAWDPDLQRSTDDAYEEVELALAATALDNRLQWDKGRTFKFGKTLTLPFFHSGVVELPSGGEKRPKNSKKNHMIFWVNSGRVQVDISGTEFSIGRGGMWQVPRGNMYTLTNPYRQSARIFFAQASYMEQPEDEAALMAAASGLA